MTWWVELLAALLMVAAAAAFIVGALSLGAEEELLALYWFAVGGLSLKSCSDLLRPSTGARS